MRGKISRLYRAGDGEGGVESQNRKRETERETEKKDQSNVYVCPVAATRSVNAQKPDIR